MKMMIESTTAIVKANGIDCRVWEGVTERGIKVEVLVLRIAVQLRQDMSQFEAELTETRPPQFEATAFPLRMIL